MEFNETTEVEGLEVENPKETSHTSNTETLGDVVDTQYSEYAEKAPQKGHEIRPDDIKAQEYAGSQGGSGSAYNPAVMAYDSGKKGGCECCKGLAPEWKMYHD